MGLLFIVGVLVFLDQLTKYIVVATMSLQESIPVIESVFHLTYILNSGAAFGVLEHSRWFFVIMAVVVLGALCYWRELLFREPLIVQYGAAFFSGGALGNLVDRIRLGAVVDFLDFRVWPIFNVADIAICVGVGLVIWSMLQTERKLKKHC